MARTPSTGSKVSKASIMWKVLNVAMAVVMAVGLVPLPAFASVGDSAANASALTAQSVTLTAQSTGTNTYLDGSTDYLYYYDVIADAYGNPTSKCAIRSIGLKDGSAYAAEEYRSTRTLKIPEKISDYTVVQLGGLDDSDVTFYWPSDVQVLKIPSTVEAIKRFDAVMTGARYVQEIDFSENHQITKLPANFVATWADGYATDAAEKGQVLKKVTLPESLVTIGDHAFQGCRYLTDVNFPSTLKTIEKNAFLGTGLTSINLNNGLETIGDGAFYSDMRGRYWDGKWEWDNEEAESYGIKATSLKIPDSVTSIGNYVFAAMSTYERPLGNDVVYSRTSMTSRYETLTIGGGVKSIGAHAFDGLFATSVTLPASLETLGDYAFANSPRLEQVTWASGSTTSVKAIGDYAFNGDRALKSISIPSGVESIGEGAFGYCTSLKSATLPESVTEVGSSAFGGDTALATAKMPGVKTIGNSAFASCETLTGVAFPNCLETIGDYAFVGTSAITSITIPASVSKIGSHAFGDYIVDDYYDGATGLTPKLRGCGMKSLVIEQGDGNVPLDIGMYAFEACVGLNGTNITLPARVKYLGGGAFWFIQNADFYIGNPDIVLYGPIDVFDHELSGTYHWIAGFFHNDNGDGNASTSDHLEMPNPWSAKSYAQDGKYLPEKNGSTVHFPKEISRNQVASGENVPNFWAYLNGVKFCTDGGLYSGRTPQFTDDAGTIINAKPSIADAEVEWPYIYGGTNDFYYNGKAHTLEKLSVTYKGIELKEGEDYKLSYSNNVNAGNNTAICTITGINNYRGTKTVKFSIGKGTSTISLAAQSKAYTGKALAYSGKVTRTGSEGAVTYYYYSDAACEKPVAAKNVVNLGTYYVKATVAAKGNWGAATSAAVKFTVTKGTSTISLAAQSKVYTGKALAYSGKVTKSGSAGAVAYKYYSDAACKNEVKAANVKNVGVYYVKATVAAEGNWKAATSAAVKFTIVPKGTKLSSLKALRKGFTAKWGKRATQTTGYQLQYALNKKFTSAKTVTVKGAKAVSKKVTKLKAKKKYWVRVRTYKAIGKATYCSSWSAAKTVKAK